VTGYADPIMSAPVPRPRVVTAAFWCWVAASVIVMTGGMITATVDYPVFRVAGLLTILAGGAMAFLVGRVRRGADERFRRAALALSLALVAYLVVLSVVGILFWPTLVAALPLFAGAILITRSSASEGDAS
jgi:peptidoglycan/LPS O-acetylase OafA/YrhL